MKTVTGIVLLPLTLSYIVGLPAITAETPCYYREQTYPHGTRLGAYICNCGTWEPIQ
ncbi:hypothetical protein C1752_13140 [Acaryochloris thomasi RCC1774]|uniref:Uncharacterized protein n=1 Tax=Acaryochloris thomasi RCC1774 TaxID=1764569 RepID=A0A2W1JJH8_9CYAN|nr:hypothetical protein C1752_13140 [Acaryochloris thomasi RCC1774]